MIWITVWIVTKHFLRTRNANFAETNVEFITSWIHYFPFLPIYNADERFPKISAVERYREVEEQASDVDKSKIREGAEEQEEEIEIEDQEDKDADATQEHDEDDATLGDTTDNNLQTDPVSTIINYQVDVTTPMPRDTSAQVQQSDIGANHRLV